MIVAIDGPAGSGKSTVARGVARRLGFTHLDSGALYRAVTLLALENGIDPRDGAALAGLAAEISLELRDHQSVQVLADGRDVSEEIRAPAVTLASSMVAAHPEVRSVLLEKQRSLIAAGNHVVEGRDIGTVVAPTAAVKVFLTANPDERARRRAAELEQRGDPAEADAVKTLLEQRDLLDTTRSAAPLRPAEDAVEVDTTRLSPEAAIERVVELVEQARAPR